MKVSISRFRCYDEKREFSFLDANLILISARSGGGKSTLFEAILWALFGSMTSIYSNGIAGTQKLKTKVELTIGDLTIERVKPPEILTVVNSDNTINLSNHEAQLYLNTLFGDQSTFVSAGYSRQNTRHPLLTSSSSEKFDLLKILSFGDCSNSDNDPDVYLTKIEDKLESIKTRIALEKNTVSLLTSQVSQAKQAPILELWSQRECNEKAFQFVTKQYESYLKTKKGLESDLHTHAEYSTILTTLKSSLVEPIKCIAIHSIEYCLSEINPEETLKNLKELKDKLTILMSINNNMKSLQLIDKITKINNITLNNLEFKINEMLLVYTNYLNNNSKPLTVDNLLSSKKLIETNIEKLNSKVIEYETLNSNYQMQLGTHTILLERLKDEHLKKCQEVQMINQKTEIEYQNLLSNAKVKYDLQMEKYEMECGMHANCIKEIQLYNEALLSTHANDTQTYTVQLNQYNSIKKSIEDIQIKKQQAIKKQKELNLVAVRDYQLSKTKYSEYLTIQTNNELASTKIEEFTKKIENIKKILGVYTSKESIINQINIYKKILDELVCPHCSLTFIIKDGGCHLGQHTLSDKTEAEKKISELSEFNTYLDKIETYQNKIRILEKGIIKCYPISEPKEPVIVEELGDLRANPDDTTLPMPPMPPIKPKLKEVLACKAIKPTLDVIASTKPLPMPIPLTLPPAPIPPTHHDIQKILNSIQTEKDKLLKLEEIKIPNISYSNLLLIQKSILNTPKYKQLKSEISALLDSINALDANNYLKEYLQSNPIEEDSKSDVSEMYDIDSILLSITSDMSIESYSSKLESEIVKSLEVMARAENIHITLQNEKLSYNNILSNNELIQTKINTAIMEFNSKKIKSLDVIEKRMLDVQANIARFELLNSSIPQARHLLGLNESLSIAEDKLNSTIHLESNLIYIKQIILDTTAETITDTLDNINNLSNAFLQDLFDEDIIIEFLTYKTTKSNKTKLQINLKINYKGSIYENPNALSGGEQDRLSLAITLALCKITDSKILMLDECLASLNSELKEKSLKLIKRYFKDVMVLHVCHESVSGMHDSILSI